MTGNTKGPTIRSASEVLITCAAWTDATSRCREDFLAQLLVEFPKAMAGHPGNDVGLLHDPQNDNQLPKASPPEAGRTGPCGPARCVT